MHVCMCWECGVYTGMLKELTQHEGKATGDAKSSVASANLCCPPTASLSQSHTKSRCSPFTCRLCSFFCSCLFSSSPFSALFTSLALSASRRFSCALSSLAALHSSCSRSRHASSYHVDTYDYVLEVRLRMVVTTE